MDTGGAGATSFTFSSDGPSAQPLLVEDLNEPNFPDPFIGHEGHPGFVAVLAEVAVAEVRYRSPDRPGGVCGEAATLTGSDGTDLKDLHRPTRARAPPRSFMASTFR